MLLNFPGVNFQHGVCALITMTQINKSSWGSSRNVGSETGAKIRFLGTTVTDSEREVTSGGPRDRFEADCRPLQARQPDGDADAGPTAPSSGVSSFPGGGGDGHSTRAKGPCLRFWLPAGLWECHPTGSLAKNICPKPWGSEGSPQSQTGGSMSVPGSIPGGSGLRLPLRNLPSFCACRISA